MRALLIAGISSVSLGFAAGEAAGDSPSTMQKKASDTTPKAMVASFSVAMLDFDSFAAEMPSQMVAGFRMEGAPQVEVVFGDISHFKRHIDNFRSMQTRMDAERARFAKATHAAQRVLAKRQRHCPTDSVAEDFAQASEAGVLFRRLGADFEGTYFAIHELDQLGESAGLTPQYRWQVKKSKRQYKQALSDLKEMQGVFKKELKAELTSRGCNSRALLLRAAELAEARKIAEAKALAEKAEQEKLAAAQAAADLQETVRASTATFFVDNRACTDTLRVHVDNTMLGEVAPGTRAAFQSLAGRHSLCLLGEDDVISCGDTGTVRNAFVHDGWSVTRHCSKAN